jgi:hypothetical protein
LADAQTILVSGRQYPASAGCFARAKATTTACALRDLRKAVVLVSLENIVIVVVIVLIVLAVVGYFGRGRMGR